MIQPAGAFVVEESPWTLEDLIEESSCDGQKAKPHHRQGEDQLRDSLEQKRLLSFPPNHTRQNEVSILAECLLKF